MFDSRMPHDEEGRGYSQRVVHASADRPRRGAGAAAPEAQEEEQMTDDRYRITGDVVHDTTTGLEWQREHSGPMTWRMAMDYAAKLGDGWRLPTVIELVSLVDYDRCDPASAFPAMPSVAAFWSSSSDAGSASNAWYVNFYHGNVSNDGKTSTSYVRCVRRPVVGPSDLGRLDAMERRIAALETGARKSKPKRRTG